MSATMTMQSYQCQEIAKDWSRYVAEEGIPEKMAEVFRTWQIDYILAECKQDDGLTLCFIQTTKPWERSIMKALFPTAKWVGSTGGNEEYHEWLVTGSVDMYHVWGSCQLRVPGNRRTGRSMILEIREASRVMDECLQNEEEDEPVGALVRTYARYF